MSGNVWEWTSSLWDNEHDWRVLRGGSCCSYFVMPRGANRLAFPASYRDRDIGFRCAQDLARWLNARRARSSSPPDAAPATPPPIDLPRRSP